MLHSSAVYIDVTVLNLLFTLNRGNEAMKHLCFSMLISQKKFDESFQSNFFKVLEAITLHCKLLTCRCFPKNKNVLNIYLYRVYLVYIYRHAYTVYT